jgi:hypothetical protein
VHVHAAWVRVCECGTIILFGSSYQLHRKVILGEADRIGNRKWKRCEVHAWCVVKKVYLDMYVGEYNFQFTTPVKNANARFTMGKDVRFAS